MCTQEEVAAAPEGTKELLRACAMVEEHEQQLQAISDYIQSSRSEFSKDSSSRYEAVEMQGFETKVELARLGALVEDFRGQDRLSGMETRMAEQGHVVLKIAGRLEEAHCFWAAAPQAYVPLEAHEKHVKETTSVVQDVQQLLQATRRDFDEALDAQAKANFIQAVEAKARQEAHAQVLKEYRGESEALVKTMCTWTSECMHTAVQQQQQQHNEGLRRLQQQFETLRIWVSKAEKGQLTTADDTKDITCSLEKAPPAAAPWAPMTPHRWMKGDGTWMQQGEGRQLKDEGTDRSKRSTSLPALPRGGGAAPHVPPLELPAAESKAQDSGLSSVASEQGCPSRSSEADCSSSSPAQAPLHQELQQPLPPQQTQQWQQQPQTPEAPPQPQQTHPQPQPHAQEQLAGQCRKVRVQDCPIDEEESVGGSDTPRSDCRELRARAQSSPPSAPPPLSSSSSAAAAEPGRGGEPLGEKVRTLTNTILATEEAIDSLAARILSASPRDMQGPSAGVRSRAPSRSSSRARGGTELQQVTGDLRAMVDGLGAAQTAVTLLVPQLLQATPVVHRSARASSAGAVTLPLNDRGRQEAGPASVGRRGVSRVGRGSLHEESKHAAHEPSVDKQR